MMTQLRSRGSKSTLILCLLRCITSTKYTQAFSPQSHTAHSNSISNYSYPYGPLLRYRRDGDPGEEDHDARTIYLNNIRSKLLTLGMPRKSKSRAENMTGIVSESMDMDMDMGMDVGVGVGVDKSARTTQLVPSMSRKAKLAERRSISKNLRKRQLSTKTRAGVTARKNKTPTVIVTNAHELRSAVFDQGVELKDIGFRDVPFMPSRLANQTQSKTVHVGGDGVQDDVRDALNHDVIKLIEKRFRTGSKPGDRAPDDDANLALSIEGGGMRGAVSAGMASAIAVLGLSDVFDGIYGSSAGSVIGAYMVSRQMCIDVYTDVLTTAKTKFVSKGRLASSLATNLFDQKILNSTTDVFSRYVSPAMNISFVLDSIMCPEKGLRPLDMETFRINDEVQQLRVVTSTVRQGKMETHCLGSKTMDFFDRINEETGEVLEYASTNRNVGGRHGFFAGLETSMLVPAATGPPQPLLRHRDAHQNITTYCFDAFCYEPIPYRSAVKEGATHVLALKSRPTGSPIGTKPGLFEKVFAPMYFDRNGMPEVSTYFQNGGQQYIYTEDYLTLEEGRKAKPGSDGVCVPPPKILYGVDRDQEAEDLVANRDKWDKAHLFPLSVPEGKPELSTLSVDADEVCEAVRLGFACAFDLLAPVTGIELNSHLDGNRVAELLFSHAGISPDVLKDPVSIAGVSILENEQDITTTMAPLHSKHNDSSSSFNEISLQQELFDRNRKFVHEPTSPCPKQDASELLESLPGFHAGRMESLSLGLRELKRGSRGRTKI